MPEIMNVEFRELLLSVWREACRHIEIHESSGMIARLLAKQLPLEAVLVREFDLKRSCLETVAIGLAGRHSAVDCGRTELGRLAMRRLLVWCRRGSIGHRTGRTPRPSEWASLLPVEFGGDVVAGPLMSEGAPLGVLLLLSRPGVRFEAQHLRMLRGLLEPYTVALENDHRLRELKSLREAAEADKQSLLIRLGRSQLMDTVVGAEAGLRPVMERVKLVARSDVPVLILGETGTGKEVIARTIHSDSARGSGPFLRVNCGAIPAELIDSQLFGHERGSFTGATDLRKGWFERADGGTLFLDEIGELPLAAQVRLLRILQDGYLERIGAEEEIKVDVRMVAATHRDLTAMVRDGRFREDLWYRIAVFQILLPPLRERPEDIAELAKHFAIRAATRFRLQTQLPTGNDIALLASYAWPGNVRELGAVIDRAAILGNGERLEVAKALGVPVPTLVARGAADDTRPVIAPSPASSLVPIDAAMRQHIETALAATLGRIEGPHGAARVLGINPHTLRARMRKLGIEWSRFRSRA